MSPESIEKAWLIELSGLDEVQRRRFAAIKAMELGRGGITKVCKITGMSHNTVDKGIKEVSDLTHLKKPERLRKPGGGRKTIISKYPNVKKEICLILDENTAGDPMSPLKWTNKSTYSIAKKLKSRGYTVSEDTVGRIVKHEGYTLQANKKSKESGSSAERDSQFRYINKMIAICIKKNIPFISVDAKKKELIGNFKNAGKIWLKKGQAEIVNVYDFESLAEGKAIPYGIYELLRNNGFVNIGISSNTSEFAVESIKQWWKNIGVVNYPVSRELFICADSGGSNSSRSRLWKYYLHEFARENKLKVTVCHYPPGTSKWNKIEHKMFSFISMNWRGKPLRTYEIILNLIRGTTTKTGLKISAKIDKKIYETGKNVHESDFQKINIKPRRVNPKWNYTLNGN